jgi:transposase, IS5 family
MKAHISTDTQGWIYSVAVTDTSVHDSQFMNDCLHGEEQAIYGDKTYVNETRK